MNLSIGKRLALGFLLPALIAALTLGSVGLQSQQRFLQEATFYQHLLNTYTSLTTTTAHLEQMHTQVLQTVTYANQPDYLPQVLSDDQQAMQASATSCKAMLTPYLQQDLIERDPDLVALFTEAGHGAQIEEQRTYSTGAQAAWQSYCTQQDQVLAALSSGRSAEARTLVGTQVDEAFADTERELHTLITFSGSLAPSLHDAAAVEVQKLFFTTLLSGAALLLGIAIVGWLISSTLVRRLQRLRTVAQDIANGEVHARLEVVGRDEIADVSRATNSMVDTLLGLLAETKQQRDELAKGEELKRLHETLQRQHEALNQANARLEHLSTTDMLTGLPNHRALSMLLEREGERARRFGHCLSVLFFDGDRFKQVNDTYGHAMGDLVLRELGQRASSVLRAGDTVGRFGGEEFLVLLPETSAQEAKEVAERLRSAVAASPLAAHEVEGAIALTVSIGVASYPSDGTTASEVREQADQAMYWAKRLGRNQVRTAAEAARANRDAALKAATAQSLERQEHTTRNGHDPESRVRAEHLGLIYSLMGALDWREPGMNAHANEVSDLVAGMARLLGFDAERTRRAATAAFLHDIGKIAIPDRLLQQPREHFSAQEWRLLHQHAELGAAIVEASPWLSDLAPAIRFHHEHWDGTGTPEGLVGEAIPLEARMIAVAEAYHSMISAQPYQAARSATEAVEELERHANTQFDPALLPVFRATLEGRETWVSSSWEHARPERLTHI